ncbi:MAG TPA: hypothetical protein VGD31_10240 [Sphingobacteriaceae bacterium]
MADTPAKKAAPSLRDLTNKSTPAKSTPAKATSEKVDEEHANIVPEAVTEKEVASSLKEKPDLLPPDKEDESDRAPGHGIISEKDHEEDRDVTHSGDVKVDTVGVLSRVNKMSPPGMTVLNTYSGGSETIIHDKQDVVIKPLSEAENRSHRVIEDETGKSRLLHPEVTRPTIPSEQATVQGTYQEHVYATPYDPNNDPNR